MVAVRGRSLWVIASVGALAAGLALVSGQNTGGGRPNFEGIWNSATVTPLERPSELRDKAFFTPAEAAEWERQVTRRNEEPPPEVAAKSQGYRHVQHVLSRIWNAHRQDAPHVDRHRPSRRPHSCAHAGGCRSQAPPSGAAKTVRERRRARPPGSVSGVRHGRTADAPVSYNSNYHIVQTRDAMVVHAEMIHDTRIIHLDGRSHLPSNVRQWLGDSIGRWEGNTLVVDTTNFRDGSGYYGDAGGNFAWDGNLHLVERLSLIDAETLLYQFEIDDPTVYVRPWKGELTLARAVGPIYEFACHEGNYSLTNMLRGYRSAERKAGVK